MQREKKIKKETKNQRELKGTVQDILFPGFGMEL